MRLLLKLLLSRQKKSTYFFFLEALSFSKVHKNPSITIFVTCWPRHRFTVCNVSKNGRVCQKRSAPWHPRDGQWVVGTSTMSESVASTNASCTVCCSSRLKEVLHEILSSAQCGCHTARGLHRRSFLSVALVVGAGGRCSHL